MKISAETKSILIPVFGAFLLLVVGIYAGSPLVKRVSQLRASLNLAKNSQNSLQAKQNSLLQLAQSSTNADDLAIALPPDNSAILFLSQIKAAAIEAGVSLDNMKVGAQLQTKGSSLSHVNVNFDLSGDLNSVISFMTQIRNSAPVSTIKTASLTQSLDSYLAAIVISVYWAPFPEKIPSVTEPLLDLTAEERDMMFILTNLKKPEEFVATGGPGLTPTEPVPRPNPFSL